MSRGGPRHRSRHRRPDDRPNPEGQGSSGEPGAVSVQQQADAGTPLPPGVALERLRDRVIEAARELQRLREENVVLSGRLAEMEQDLRGKADPSLLKMDESPEALREKIEGFIEAIDEYLAQE